MNALTSEREFVRVFRAKSELDELRTFWNSCRKPRDADLDLFLLLSSTSPHHLRPHVIVAYRDGRPCSMLIGRCEECRLDLKFGYFKIPSPKLQRLFFIHGGLLGDSSHEICGALIQSIMDSLSRGEADLATIQYVNVESPFYKVATARRNLMSSSRYQTP